MSRVLLAAVLLAQEEAGATASSIPISCDRYDHIEIEFAARLEDVDAAGRPPVGGPREVRVSIPGSAIEAIRVEGREPGVQVVVFEVVEDRMTRVREARHQLDLWAAEERARYPTPSPEVEAWRITNLTELRVFGQVRSAWTLFEATRMREGKLRLVGFESWGSGTFDEAAEFARSELLCR